MRSKERQRHVSGCVFAEPPSLTRNVVGWGVHFEMESVGDVPAAVGLVAFSYQTRLLQKALRALLPMGMFR